MVAPAPPTPDVLALVDAAVDVAAIVLELVVVLLLVVVELPVAPPAELDEALPVPVDELPVEV